MAKSDKTAGVLLMVLFGCGLFMSTAFPERSAYFPRFICIVGLFLSILLLIGAIRKEKKGQDADVPSTITPAQRKRLLIMGVMIILYAVGVAYIGFTVSSIVFMTAASWLLYPGKISKDNRRPAVVIVNLLYVPLPSGLLI